MEELEINSKTVEQAIQKASDQLGVSRDQLDVTVLSEGKAGILGVGAEEARIRVSALVPAVSPEGDLAEVAISILEKLLSMMGLSATVTAGDTVTQGQHIADSGNSGLSTGPHLHWEMRVGGVSVDGLQWVQERFP